MLRLIKTLMLSSTASLPSCILDSFQYQLQGSCSRSYRTLLYKVQLLLLQRKKIKSHDMALLLLCKQSLLYLVQYLKYCILLEGMVKSLNASTVIVQVGRIIGTLPICFLVYYFFKYISA